MKIVITILSVITSLIINISSANEAPGQMSEKGSFYKTVNAFLIYARAGSCKEGPYSSVWMERITDFFAHIDLANLKTSELKFL